MYSFRRISYHKSLYQSTVHFEKSDVPKYVYSLQTSYNIIETSVITASKNVVVLITHRKKYTLIRVIIVRSDETRFVNVLTTSLVTKSSDRRCCFEC